MGFLDRLRGGGNTTISVNAESTEAAPGAAVTLHFDVGGELDDKARGIRVGIRGTGKYKVEERNRDSNGNIQTTQVWRTIDLHEEEHAYPAQLGPGQATLTLPADAAPSAADAVEWEAFARVDREHGMDRSESLALDVRQPADRVPTERTPATSDDGLTIEEVAVAIRADDQLTGYLTITPSDDVKVTGVKMRLHRQVSYVADVINDYNVFSGNSLGFFVFGGNTSRITNDETVSEVLLADKREFAAGQTERLHFTVPVPTGYGGTSGHPHARVEWRLEAVLDRRMRGDLAVAIPVVVY